MNTSTRLALGFLSLCVPFAAAAAAPGNVTGIKATLQGGKVLVTWTPVTDQNISAYRVFFGHQSILSSNGLYDDYDTVDGSVNSYAIVNTPATDTVYVSVLAMNEQGEESPYFAEEASVSLSGDRPASSPAVVETSSAAASVQTLPASPSSVAAMQQQSSSIITQQPVGDSRLRLLAVRAVSATGVELTFSAAVSVDPALAAQAFEIRSGSGKVLPMTRLSIIGNTVLIDTVPQERGTVYAMILANGIIGTDPLNGTILTLDDERAPVLFTGSQDGITATPEGSGSASSAPAVVPAGSDVSNLALRAQEEKTGMYTIQVTWQIPESPTLIGFQVTQSTDNGKTYSSPSNLSVNTNSITVPHVPGGHYGVMIRAVYADGTISQGVTKNVELAGAPTGGLSGNVNGKPPVTHLPQSGPGLWMLLVTLGSALGYAGVKRYGHVDMVKA